MAVATSRARYPDRLWGLWPWLGWGLPVLQALLVFWTVAELPAVGLMLAALILAGGALGLLPRFLLRRLGNETLPVPMVPVLIVHWWSWGAFIWVHAVTSARIYWAVPVLEPLGARIHDSLAERITGWAWGVYLVTLLALLVMSCVRGLGTVRTSGLWTGAALTAAIGVPALALAASAMVQSGIQEQRDAAGETVTAAQRRPFDERVDLIRERYSAAQREVAEVRSLIEPGALWGSAHVFVNRAQSFDRNGAESYEFHIEYELGYEASPAQAREVAEHLEHHGWRIVDARIAEGANELWAEHEDGRRLRLFNSGPQDLSQLDFISQEWWTGDDDGEIGAACPTAGLSDFFSTEHQRREADARSETDAESPRFAAGEWPAC